ncbi:MAG: hypothetical protein U0414_04980 [Polyangiaceae bacterium]
MGGGEGRSSGGRHPCSPWAAFQGSQDTVIVELDGMIKRRRRRVDPCLAA